MGVAATWAVIAARLCANLAITVSTGLTCYWLSLAAVLAGGCFYLASRGAAVAPVSRLRRLVPPLLALQLVLVGSLGSNIAFRYWRLRAIPRGAWRQMALDLESVGRQSAEGGGWHSFSRKVLPKSLHRLGLGEDYNGGSAQLVSSPEYSGVVACVNFGCSVRTWGLCVGPESFVEARWPGCKHIRVGETAFFFTGFKR